MVSDYRRKKYAHVFYVFLDSDKSGSVDRKDFSLTAAKIAKKRGYNAGDVIYEIIKEMLTKLWEGLLQDADTDGDGVINIEEWVQLWDKFAQNPAGAKDWQKLLAKCLFQLADAANDGAVDAEEFSSICEIFGLNKNDSVEAFNKMAAGKSKIGWDDYEKLVVEYFTTDDVNAPGNYIFGKPKA